MTFRRWKRVVIALGAAVVVLAAAAVWLIGLVSAPHGTGYLSPVFAPDGVSILAIRRDVSALVTGFGWEFFTPPATVRVRRDRFELLSVRVADGQITVLETFPPSPLEGNQIRAYHGGIFGVAHAELRWADATHLDYEIAVTRHDSPLARTFVVRRAWNPTTGTYLHTTPWQETSSGMGGDEHTRFTATWRRSRCPATNYCHARSWCCGGTGQRRLLSRRPPAGASIREASLWPFSRR